jgi:hypothetical protein
MVAINVPKIANIRIVPMCLKNNRYLELIIIVITFSMFIAASNKIGGNNIIGNI